MQYWKIKWSFWLVKRPTKNDQKKKQGKGVRKGLKIDNKQQCVEKLKSDKYTIHDSND